MELDGFTFIAQIINFLILLWLMQRFLYKPVLKVMQKREDEIKARLDEAQKTLKEAEAKREAYQQKMDQFHQNEKTMMNEARQEAEEYRKNLLTQARYEIEKLQDRWKKTVDEERDQFLTDLGKKAFDTIMESVQNIVNELSGQELEHYVLAEFIHKTSTITAEQIAAFTESNDHHLEVSTAFALKEKDRIKLKAILKEIFSDDINCEFLEDPELGLGIEIRTSGWKMGWSLKSYIEVLKAEMESFLKTKAQEEVHSEIKETVV